MTMVFCIKDLKRVVGGMSVVTGGCDWHGGI